MQAPLLKLSFAHQQFGPLDPLPRPPDSHSNAGIRAGRRAGILARTTPFSVPVASPRPSPIPSSRVRFPPIRRRRINWSKRIQHPNGLSAIQHRHPRI
jgi:hypothetical protein